MISNCLAKMCSLVGVFFFAITLLTNFVQGDICPNDEVENLALIGSVTQSGNENEANVVTDGDKTPALIEHSLAQCSYTDSAADLYSWWQVDLALPKFIVTSVIIYSNMTNSDTEFHVGVGDIKYHNGYVLNKISKMMQYCQISNKYFFPPKKSKFVCNNLEGNYVTVISNDQNQTLILCEVEIYGKNGQNIAYEKPTAQSSTVYDAGSGLAVDGNKPTDFYSISQDGTAVPQCTHTSENTDSFPWWRVDLTSNYVIEKVNIYNRGEGLQSRLHDVEIRIGINDIDYEISHENQLFEKNPLCKAFPDNFFPPGLKEVQCIQPLVGRYVSIQIVKKCEIIGCISSRANIKNSLTLCEVEVIGEAVFLDEKTDILTNEPHFTNYNNNGIRIDHPWVEIDLKSADIVDSIELTFNYLTPEGISLPEFEIRVGKQPVTSTTFDNEIISSNLPCAKVKNLENINSGTVIEISCTHPILGRYITIQAITHCDDHPKCNLVNFDYIDSILVWGYKSDEFKQSINVAAFKETTQSSIAHSGGSNLAVSRWLPDMESNQDKCSKTSIKKFPWWRIDLHHQHFIYYINVYTPQNQNFTANIQLQVRIGNSDVAQERTDTFFVKNPSCVLMKEENFYFCEADRAGRYVSVHLVDNAYPNKMRSLELCEVEIYGCEI